MDALHRRERATAAEIHSDIPDAPSYSTVRAILRILEQKRHIWHEEDGPRYVFHPVIPRASERRLAIKHLMRTFFDGSITDAVQALIDTSENKLTKEELDELSRQIAAARKEGR